MSLDYWQRQHVTLAVLAGLVVLGIGFMVTDRPLVGTGLCSLAAVGSFAATLAVARRDRQLGIGRQEDAT